MSFTRWSSEVVWQHDLYSYVIAFAIFFLSSCRLKTIDQLGGTANFWLNELRYLGMVAIGMSLLRAPTWMMGETNMDEAQWLAGTITLDREFAFWGRVDTMTSGPLNVHFLWLWTLLCGEHTFQMTKPLTTIIAILITWFTYGTIRQFTDRQRSRWLIVSFATAIGFMRLNDYVGYNGEQLPVLLHSACVLVILRAQLGKHTSHLEWLLVGVALGAVPYTKIQAAPIGFFLGCWALVLLRQDRRAFTLVSSVLVVNGAVWGTLWMSGQVEDYWTRCIAQTLEYSHQWSSIPFVKRFYVFPIAWVKIAEARWFLIACLSIVAASIVLQARARSSTPRSRQFITLGPVCYVLVSAYCVTQSGNFFTHYYFFMLHPVFICAAVFALVAQRSLEGDEQANTRMLSGFSVACGCLLIAAVVPGFLAARSEAVRRTMNATLDGEHPAAARIRQLVGPDTVLAVWGWKPRFYVDTQLPQATSESLTYYQIAPGSLQDYHLSRFAAEIASHKDVIFVDITGDGGTYLLTEPKHDHRQFELINKFVDERMEYVDTVGGARIYRSRAFDQ